MAKGGFFARDICGLSFKQTTMYILQKHVFYAHQLQYICSCTLTLMAGAYFPVDRKSFVVLNSPLQSVPHDTMPPTDVKFS